jgi:TrmH family RNA methyltransferase
MSAKEKIKPYKKGAEYSYTLGAFPTIELLKSRPEIVEEVYIHSTFTVPEVLEQICQEHHIRVTVADRIIERLSDKENVFVIGVFQKYEDILEPESAQLVLVNPSNMGNMGTIMRTCIGFGIKDLAIISPGVDVFNPKVVRSSMGALFRIRHQYFDSFEEYLAAVTKRDIFLFMLTGKEQQTVIECKKPHCFSLVFGNEATGLPPEYEQYGTSIIIPQSEEVDSLNLTIAVGVGTFLFTHHLKEVNQV